MYWIWKQKIYGIFSIRFRVIITFPYGKEARIEPPTFWSLDQFTDHYTYTFKHDLKKDIGQCFLTFNNLRNLWNVNNYLTEPKQAEHKQLKYGW